MEVAEIEYIKTFSVNKDNVKASLFDGKGSMSEKYDLVLDISSTEKNLNEGELQDKLKKSFHSFYVNNGISFSVFGCQP